MAVLKAISGALKGEVIPLVKERSVIGRHPQCDVVLESVAISRNHAQILAASGEYYLEDLHSRNGTKLNQSAIRGRVELQDGDLVEVCDNVFEFFRKLPERPMPRTPAPRDGAGTLLQTLDDPANGPLFDPLPPTTRDGGLQGSSIITTLDTATGAAVRVHVKPETKLRALLEITSALSGILKVEAVLPAVLKTLFKIFPQAEWGFVLMQDGPKAKLRMRATHSRREDGEQDVPVSMTIVRQAMESGRAILSADAFGDQRFDQAASVAAMKIRSVICAPLLCAEGKATGVIQLSTEDISQQFSADDLDLLASVSRQAAMAIENAALHEALLVQQDLDQELRFAMQVQQGFLPSEAPHLEGFEFADYYEPARQVGGDYFDYIPLPGGGLAVCIGDVAGKGVPAALMMARLYASVRYQLARAISPAESLNQLNREFASSGLGHRFITLAMLAIHPERNELVLANAGHLPPLVRRADGTVEPVGTTASGIPLGIADAVYSYREAVVPFGVGDTLVLYTDGVTEAMNDAQEIFGRQRLGEAVGRGAPESRPLVEQLVREIERFQGDSGQRDDLCVVAFRRTAG